MSAKVTQKTETANILAENGKLCYNGKTYAECNFDEKQEFNHALNHEEEDLIVAMLERMTKPLISQFVPLITDTQLYKSEPHFV